MANRWPGCIVIGDLVILAVWRRIVGRGVMRALAIHGDVLIVCTSYVSMVSSVEYEENGLFGRTLTLYA